MSGGSEVELLKRFVNMHRQNNKYMGDRFDPKSESSYLQDLDANNLYGWAMSQPLPTGGFKWIDVNSNEISELATRTDKGYVLEVDVSYPKARRAVETPKSYHQN